MPHQALSPAFHALIDTDAPVTRAATGFTFVEGPVWHPAEQCLFFSDMPADKRRRLGSDGRVREVAKPSNKGNGMTLTPGLELVVCEHSTSSVVRIGADGRRTVLASHFEGRELNSPNDLCIRSDGSIYFSDPWYGRMAGFGVERPRELGWQGVFRIPPGATAPAEPELVVGRYVFGQPNGLCFSPDERLLYVNDTEQANIRVFEVRPDGSLGSAKLFASGIRDSRLAGLPDGMKCDEAGNVWVTAPGGVWVFDPGGRLIGKLSVPEEVANLHWGGPDWRTLHLCATSSIYTVRTKIGPRREPFMAGKQAAKGEDTMADGSFRLDASRCALLIQDMQNDVVSEGGAFAASGAPAHCREQNAIENTRRLAERCRELGIPVIHVWFLVDPGLPGFTLNAPLFEGVMEDNALLRGTWGAEPVPGLEPQAGDIIVPKMRMSAWEGTTLETVLKATGRDILLDTGAWTNMSIEHTARTGADKGFIMIVPEDCCSTMNADWHRASIDYAMKNVAAVTGLVEVMEALENRA